MTGHWEMMGIYTTKPFKTFTENGFPEELIKELEERTGRTIIGNKSASGTEILEELGEEEIATGHMIVYTSADSVLQICGNEETFGLDELYRCCEIARELTMKDEWKVGRVIARPYVGKKKGEFVRTSNRHDYAVKPPGPTVLDALKKAGYDEDFSAALVASVGPLGQIIPPSIPMVLWATMAGISVSDLFLAGVFPGILMALALCICSYIIAKRRGFRRVGKRAPAHEVFHALKEGIWALLMPVIILGSIYGGVCSPTEAGGVVCFYALFVGFFIYRELKIKDMMGILINTVKTTAMVVFMVGCANLWPANSFRRRWCPDSSLSAEINL